LGAHVLKGSEMALCLVRIQEATCPNHFTGNVIEDLSKALWARERQS